MSHTLKWLNVEHAHQAVAIEAGVCCVHVCNFSIIACIVLILVLIYKIL
jgi:large-conductance mechanosensitive channel